MCDHKSLDTVYNEFFDFVDSIVPPLVIPDVGNVKGMTLTASDILSMYCQPTTSDNETYMDLLYDEWIKQIREAGL